MNVPEDSASNPLAKTSADVFEQAFRNSPALQSIVRLPEGVLIEVNESFARLLGYPHDEVIGKTPVELNFWVSPEQLPVYRQRLLAEGRVRDFELEARARDGTIRTILLSSDVVNINGTLHAVSAGVDITERKKAEADLRLTTERLRQSEERFSKAFRANPTMMTITRFDNGKFVTVNEAFLRLIGYTEAEVIGRTGIELKLHIVAEQRAEFFRRMSEQGFVRDMELVVCTKNGQHRTLLASGELTDIDGTPHMLTAGLDITERKEAEAKLRESERRLRESENRARALYESISAAVIVQDETGFVQANAAALKLVGLTQTGEFLGRRPPDFSAPIQADGEPSEVAARRHIERAMSQGWDHFEWIARRVDGTHVPVEVTLTTLQLEGKTVIQSVIFDLTERKRAEAELQNALAKERELNELKSDFVSLVSHEFRTPLEVIMSSVDNLDRYHERLAAEKRAELLRTIKKSVRRMAEMMEDVLLLGRFDASGTEFRPAPLDLRAFCQRVRDEMEAATARRCPISVEFENDLAGARGDESVLRHILTNLLSNAVKYSPAGEPAELAVRREGMRVVIRIADHGCGIPEADQKRLFQAFHRGSNVRQVPGTGLGLLIVQRCVALHGGEIAFESTEGRGTTFTVRLPLFAS